MTTPNPDAIYPRDNDTQTVFLKSVVTRPNISVGEYSYYNDLFNDPRKFEDNNVLYHYPVNKDRLIIGKFCSIASGARFLMNSSNHRLTSLATFPFPIFGAQFGEVPFVTEAWDNHGDIVIGSDVWIGFEAVLLSGVHVGDGAIIATRATVTRDVEPYTIVGGTPAKPIRKRFPPEVVADLLALRWWDWPSAKIMANIRNIQAGDIAALKAA